MWTVNTYTLTFDAQKGTVSPTSKTVICDAAAGDLPTPTRVGYIFGGWYTATSGGGTQYTATTVVTSNLTLYAKWVDFIMVGSGGNIEWLTL
jgi:uncharacterized repeat protein (TIGR02543 family)